MTAHPTEARRPHDALEARPRVRDAPRARRAPATIDDQAVAADELMGAVQELWASDEIRAVSPTVLDEVQTGLAYLRSTIAQAVPAIYRELEAAIAEVYPDADITVPPLLRFGTWMGGDRDGNPYVTPEVTTQALAMMRTACIGFLRDQVIELSSRVSISSRLTGPPAAIAPLLAAGDEDFPRRRSTWPSAAGGTVPARVRAHRAPAARHARGRPLATDRRADCSTISARVTRPCGPAAGRTSPTTSCAT